MSTKNLSAGSIKVNLDSQDPASGISKMLDNAESIEDKKDQQTYFYHAEQEFWTLLSKNLIPYWTKQNSLKADLVGSFSQDFAVSVLFQEPKVMVTDREKVELSKMRLEAGLSTLENELKYLNPQMDQEEIDNLMADLEKEKANSMTMQISQFGNQDDNDDEMNE
jgi:hypothetical protein